MIDTVTGFKEVARLVHGLGWPVTFLGGWETHGRGTLIPRGAVNHWTAGPPTGDHPSLDTVRWGRPGLRNALANTYSSREPRLYIVAAKVAWHAGKGSWRGLRGNSSVAGHEPENSGQGEWSEEHLALIADLDWAQCVVFGYSVEMVCDHFEWTTRKPDRGDVGGPPWRERVRGLLEGDKPTPEPSPAWKPEMGGSMIRIWHGRDTVDRDAPAWWHVDLQGKEYTLLGDGDTIETWVDRVERDDHPDVVGHSEPVDSARPPWFAGLKRA